ncbi:MULTISPECIES: hypothetical protein [Rheinheimera]|uniref:hypothetical protein n=1 Tax=Rheinheimera TaxID=67575 RepID=UPI001E28E2D4|nr:MULTISPECIES: hypothetical protein [Rheinheimera]MDF3125403.1 hypothetical protein [Rheinheimera sp. 1928-s]
MTEFKDLTKKKASATPDEVSPELLDEISGGTNPEQADDSECIGFACGSYKENQQIE